MTAHPFRHRVQVRYLEADQQGVVFNMWYLAYFDDAMTAYLDSCGVSYPRMLAAGYDVQLVHTEIDWTGPLRFGDTASIAVTATRVGRTSLTLRFEVFGPAGDEPAAVGSTVYVVVATDGSGKRDVPQFLRAALAAVGGQGRAPAEPSP